MRTRLLPFVLLCSIITSAQDAGNFALAVDPPGDNTYARYIDGAVSTAGDIAMLGGYQYVNASAFTLSKFDATGTLLWSRKVETTNPDFGMDARKVVFDAEGNLVVFGIMGTSSGQNYFMVRLSAIGDVLWTRMYHAASATTQDYGFSSMKATSDGGLLMDMGMVNKTIVLRTDMEGQISWARSYITSTGPTLKNPGFDFATTSDGGILLTEKAENDIYLVRIASNGDLAWAQRYPNGYYNHTKTAIPLSDGGFLAAGFSNNAPFAMRMDAGGNVIWERSYAFDMSPGNGYVEYFERAVELSNGELLLTASQSTSGVAALRITPLGEPVEVITLGTNGYTALMGQDAGHVVLSGRMLLAVNGGYEDRFLLLRLNEALDMECLRGTGTATATDIEAASPPSSGCTVQDEVVNDWAFSYLVSNAVFTTENLCASVQAINEQKGSDALRVFPSPVRAGNTLCVDPGQANNIARIQCIASDGRIMKVPAVRSGTGQQFIATDGWPSGLYLVRAWDANAHLCGTSRVIVE